MDPLAAGLSAGLGELAAAGRLRARREVGARSTDGIRVQVDGEDLLAFCSNDYLGLAGHPRVVEAFIAAARQWGVGSGASHLVSGHCSEHHALEEELAAANHEVHYDIVNYYSLCFHCFVLLHLRVLQ